MRKHTKQKITKTIQKSKASTRMYILDKNDCIVKHARQMNAMA